MTKYNPAAELVDVLDDSGRVVGVATRAEMRARRLPHRCTYLLVLNSRGELFIHLRTPTKDVYPSHWDVTAGGVVAAGEDFDFGARREAMEELGVDVSPERLFPFEYADDRAVLFGMVYLLQHDGPFRLQQEEIVRGEFIRPDRLAHWTEREPFCPDGLLVWEKYQASLNK